MLLGRTTGAYRFESAHCDHTVSDNLETGIMSASISHFADLPIIFRLSRGSSEGLWPSFVGRKAVELSGGTALVCAGSYSLISLTMFNLNGALGTNDN